MNNMIERIKQKIEARKWKITDDAFIPEIIGMQYANNMNDWCLEIIDKELAKEPQEEPNIPLECVDGSCPIALSEEYEECGMDVVHSCVECPYQPSESVEQGGLGVIEEYQQRLIRYIDAGKYRSADKKVFSENDVVYLIEHGIFPCKSEAEQALERQG